MKVTQTSWGGVADWYDDVVNSSDSYQKHVLMPNILRIVEPKKGMTILDIACGQGYFSRAFSEKGATVIASDISDELIKIAQQQKGSIIDYHIALSDKLSFVKDSSIDVVTIILALQNIEKISETITEVARTLKLGGRLIVIINHPAFRIPQKSDWGWDEKISKQFRKIFSYMSDDSIRIDMNPGEKVVAKKKFTVSFHRPLQSYFKVFAKNGFGVIRLEEWIFQNYSAAGVTVLAAFWWRVIWPVSA